MGLKRRAWFLVFLSIAISLIIINNRPTLSENYNDQWWNSSWNFRFKIEVNTGNYSRTDWPVEYSVNFTHVLESLNISGTFDNNSVRVIEYNASGYPIHEAISQFDPYAGFNASSNAVGDIIFLMNGTTPNHTTRYYYIYFDILSNGEKPQVSYTTELSYSWDGEEFTINTTLNYTFYFDTSRGENTSGLYKADYQQGLDRNNYFNPSGASDRTREWTQLTDGIYNYTYDFRNNATITYGPLRITVRQEGDEIYWNDPENKTNKTHAIKTYKFYFNHSWYLVEHNITNTWNQSIYRHSFSGMPAFDALGAYFSTYKISYDYSTDPGSWVYATYSMGGRYTGIINVNESASSFTADNSTSLNRIGITFQNTTIEPNQSIWDLSAFVFTEQSIDIVETAERLVSPVLLNVSSTERLSVKTRASADHAIYNRNETIVITGTVIDDPWNITRYMNATLNRGTPQTSDDIEIPLYDDGTHGDAQAGDNIYTNTYRLNTTENLGTWVITITQYDIDRDYINETTTTFNITPLLYANLTIHNPNGLPRLGNATLNLTNFRQDIPQSGAVVNCTSNGVPLPSSNITDNGDGTYQILFLTPNDYGLYVLSCTAQKDGNHGNDSEEYTVEAPKTNLSMETQPLSYNASNVTWYRNESFNLHLTLNNTWQSNAYDTNVTLTPSSPFIVPNTTFVSCGTIHISHKCEKDFNITILNTTPPGQYSINITADWTNLDTTLGHNFTIFNITVLSHPILNVIEENITGIIAPGNDTVISSFTVESAGNDVLNNVTFSVSGLSQFTITFSPPNITSLSAGQSQNIDVRVSVSPDQSPGIYNGTINVTSDNGGYNILPFTIIVTGTNMSVSSQPENYTAENVTFYRNETFQFFVNATNTGNTTAFNAYINLSLPQNWFSNHTNISCGNISRGDSCSYIFNITIGSGTYSGNYTVNATIIWDDIRIGTKTNTTQVFVVVVKNVTLEVSEKEINVTMQHGTTRVIGNFTLISTGNDVVYNITYNLTGLENITINFTPVNVSSLPVGENITVNITASLYAGFPPGNYTGTLNISSSNDGFSLLNITIDVPENGSWTINGTYCEHIESPDSGIACTILINNTGNIHLNFTVNQTSASPSYSSDFTWPSLYNFTLQKQNSTTIEILYDITGQQKIFYNHTYNISVNSSAGEPLNVIYTVVLNPYVSPEVNITLDPPEIEQGQSLTIWSTVGSLSGASINEGNVVVNVTKPDSETNGAVMSLYQSGNPSKWVIYYPSYPPSYTNWGNTTLRGNYTVVVTATDSFGMNGSSNTTLIVYTKLVITLNTGTDTYQQGETVSLNYIARDLSGQRLENVTANIIIETPNHETIFNKTLVTNQYGSFDTLQTLSLPSDASTGTYTVTAYSTYYDSNAARTVTNTTTFYFNVVEAGGLQAHLTTTVVWYPESTMTFGINLYDASGNPLDPDSMNLTVYIGSPVLNNIYFAYNINDSIFQRVEKGFYVLSYVMPANTSSGDYWAVLHASKGSLYTLRNHPFRVATGGPYDVIISEIDQEVEQGSYLDFSVIIENMGEYGQDVDVEYWVTDSQGNNWSRETAAVFTPSGQNVTFENNLFIFSNQPTGIYTFHIKVTYSTLQNPIEKTATFSVIPFRERPPSQPPGGGQEAPSEGGGAAPSTPIIPRLEIEYFPDEIGVEAGKSRFINIKMDNTGNIDLRNITLSIEGLQPNWYSFEPEIVDIIKKDESFTVILKITVPEGTPRGDHSAKLVVRYYNTTIESAFTLFVFTSKRELVEFELARLKAKTSDLEEKAKKADKEGMDMEEVFKKIDEIKEQIRIAEDHLANDRLDAALTAIYNGWDLYRQALYLYNHAKPKAFQIPWWVILVVIFAVSMLVLIVILRKLYEGIRTLARGRMAELRLSETKGLIKSIQKESAEVEALRNQRDKLRRTLALLEEQSNKGIISKEAYLSMKKSTEEKIKKIEAQIRKALK